MKIARGQAVLREWLAAEVHDLRAMSPAEFGRWLGEQLPYWRRDPVFRQRERLRELRRGCPELREWERRRREAARADARSPQFSRLSRLEVELQNAAKAVAGLEAALARADEAARRAALAAKRQSFLELRARLEEERAQLLAAAPARRALREVEAGLARLREALGLPAAEAELARLLREQGRRSGRAGGGFEAAALERLPLLLRAELAAAVDPARLHLLQGVCLGGARVELDLLLVRQGAEEAPVQVLAAVEVKRNANDLARGFRLRQENLAWLRGLEGGYEPALYRSRRYPAGHFDRPAVHEQAGRRFLFAPESFQGFEPEPDSGLLLRGLYFLTRRGPLWGLSGGALARLRHRLATDEAWHPEDAVYLRRLREWAMGLAEPRESPEVLRLYAAEAELARQVLLVEP